MSEPSLTQHKVPRFGKSPYHDLHFIAKNYAFVIPFKEKTHALYEFSLMLEDLYGVPITSNMLVGRNIEEIAGLLNTIIAHKKNLLRSRQSALFLLLPGKASKRVMECVLRILFGYNIKIVLLAEYMPTWERKYIRDFICCNLHEQGYIDTLRLYQENVGRFAKAIVHKSCNDIAHALKNTFELPVVFLARSLDILSINDLRE
jgi:hypothetical protein